MYREPFFEILDVTELRGRSMADIAAEVLKGRKADMKEVRSDRRDRRIAAVRKEIVRRFKVERCDLSSEQVARFLKLDPTTIRHHWRKMARTAQ